MEHLSVLSPERTRSGVFSTESSAYRQDRRCRCILVLLAVVISIGMVIGIIFVAYYYFHIMGGQGFLKERAVVQDNQRDEMPYSCLPFRPMARPTNEIHGFDFSGIKRSPSIPPFYPCGDQQNSCEAFGQAVSIVALALMYQLGLISHHQEICCPVGMSCHSTSYTTSGTFCCKSTNFDSNCQASPSFPPRCPPSSFECAAVVGGGCCSNGTACSENGCIEFDGIGTPPPFTTTYFTTITSTAASRAIESSSIAPQAETGTNLIVTTITTAITMVIGGASKRFYRSNTRC